MRRPVALAATLLTACLGPQVSDELGFDGLVLPAGSTVPSIEDDPALAAQIAANDGVGVTIPLLTGFVAGQPTRYWDLGPAPDFAAPIFILTHDVGGTALELPHPPIIDAIPGDEGYSPYWNTFRVAVSAAYAGEVIPSVAALDEARASGLVGAPRLKPMNVNCPVIPASVTVEDGGDPQLAPRRATFYYRGRVGTYLDFGATPLAADNVTVPTTDLFVLRREGGEPLSEPARGVDMTGDGDTRDSNNVFARPRSDAAWSPLCREIPVTVVSTTKSIDSSNDEDIADLRSAAQLFSGGVPTAAVVAVGAEARRFNCPQGGN